MIPQIPNEPEAVRLARLFREALDADLDAQVYEMAEHWVQIEGVIQIHIDSLLFEIESMKADGIVNDAVIRELARYKELRDQVHKQIISYNGVAEQMISGKQIIYAQRGIDDAAALITASYETQIGAYFNRININAAEIMVGYLGDGTPLNRILAESFPGAWKQMTDALFQGIALGTNPRQVARDMVDGLGYGLTKATTVARTEQLRAYRQAEVQQYRESGVVAGYRRLVAKDGACIACLMSDGEFFEVMEDFSDHPNGRCTTVTVLKGMPLRDWDYGKDWFLRLDEEQQRSIMGNKYFEAWRAGKFELEALRSTTHSDIWGDSPAVTPLGVLTETQ